MLRKQKATDTFTMRLKPSEKTLIKATAKKLGFLSQKEFLVFATETIDYLAGKVDQGHNLYYGQKNHTKNLGLDLETAKKMLENDPTYPIFLSEPVSFTEIDIDFTGAE